MTGFFFFGAAKSFPPTRRCDNMSFMRIAASIFALIIFATTSVMAQSQWQARLDGKVELYQTTDFGIVVAASDSSLYAFDGQTGERLWIRRTRGLDETSVTPVPSTDVILVSSDLGDKSRIEAVDLLSGEILWRSDKVKGDVMQLAVEPQNDLLAVTLVKKPNGKAGQEFKRSPVIHVFELSSGNDLWKKELDSDVQLMPSRFDSEGDVPHTLDNYRAPLILDGRLYLFYEGVTSYDARTGKEGERERYKVNEGNLALTEADPVFDEKYLFTSGRGKIRAVDRRTFKVEWEAKDLGVTPEMAVVGDILYVRTGGQFTNVRSGEIDEKGSFGVSAIDTKNGRTLWRFKDADKGLTNFVFTDPSTIVLADKNELITLDAKTGKKRASLRHDIDKPQFVLINESRAAVVGGKDELAAFRISDMRSFEFPTDLRDGRISAFDDRRSSELWRVKHKAPSRGVFRIVAGIALRATAIYFRYGGLATSALNLVRGAGIARSVLSMRWSGLRSRFSSLDLTTLAVNSSRSYVTNQIGLFGIAARTPNLMNRLNGLQVITPQQLRGRLISGAINRATPSRTDLQESVLDRLDPVRRVEKLSDYFLRRKRLADLRGSFMYFYTDLPKPYDRKGLVGVNVHNGRDQRFAPVSEPDARFTTDETLGLLYSADGSSLRAFNVLNQ